MSLSNFDELIINRQTRRFLAAYLKSPTHTLLLTGPLGVGLGTAAATLARAVAGSNVIIIRPTLHAKQKTANINIADIKEVKKLAGNRRRAPFVVVIDDADKMTGGTPEALLKLLEEPAANAHFIITTHNMYNLPATISSRSQIIHLLPVPEADQMLNNTKPPAKQTQILFMASGLPAEISRLLADEEYFRARARQFADIKQFINHSVYQRIAYLSKIKSRDEAQQFISNLAKITVKTGQTDSLSLLSDVAERLNKNGNLKAQLAYLANFY
ncbi:MAG: AAA family ATPase [Candidatus Nomurabacteria bacterium]|jgi:DNA polymerase-3 subunit delta'|nr:AAA family ATPase [Candidatus Nomurabacteria bacterium]